MRRFWGFVLTLLATMAGFRLSPTLSALWQAHLALPALQGLHRLSATLPFPAVEPLLVAALAALRRRRARAAALAIVMGMYGLLWYPAYFAAPAPRPGLPADVEPLCLQLIDALNASDLRFEAPFDSAGDVAGLPNARVKPARYPEWMRGLDIAGVFVPWTGEALVDADAPAGYLPFTCVHELMHLGGIADEGAANIAAWRACMRRGGMYADSARLWALRYALGRLSPDARARVQRRMLPRLRGLSAYTASRGPSRLAAALGIADATRSYDALLGWLTKAGVV